MKKEIVVQVIRGAGRLKEGNKVPQVCHFPLKRSRRTGRRPIGGREADTFTAKVSGR